MAKDKEILENFYKEASDEYNPIWILNHLATIMACGGGNSTAEWNAQMEDVESSIACARRLPLNDERKVDPEFWDLLETEVRLYRKYFIWHKDLSAEIPKVMYHDDRRRKIESAMFGVVPPTPITPSSFDPSPFKNALKHLAGIYTLLSVYFKNYFPIVYPWVCDLIDLDAEIYGFTYFSQKENPEIFREFAIWMDAKALLDAIRLEIANPENMTISQLIYALVRHEHEALIPMDWAKFVLTGLSASKINESEEGFLNITPPRTVVEVIHAYNWMCEFFLKSMGRYIPHKSREVTKLIDIEIDFLKTFLKREVEKKNETY